MVSVTAGTGVPDAVIWLGENLTTLYGGRFPFATQIPPAGSIAMPRETVERVRSITSQS